MQDNLPLVSVIIPNYNHSKYLNERIDSVLAQTYPNFEVFILDDCSPDNSREVIEAYRNHPKVKEIVFNESNSGNTFHQWERGFALAQGEYMWIAESDDVADPTFLTKLMDKILANPGTVLAFCRSQMIDQDGNALRWTWDKPKRYHSNGVYEGLQFCKERLTYKNMLYNASMIVFRKSAIEQVDQLYKTFRLCGDWFFWHQICRQGKVVEIPEILNKYRQHTNKVSTAAKKQGITMTESFKCQCMIYEQFPLSLYKTLCLKGRMHKRIRKLPLEEQKALRTTYPTIVNTNMLHFVLYELDKAFHISNMI